MSSGRCEAIRDLPEPQRELLDGARRGVMTTLSANGAAHSVPVVYAIVGDEIVSPIDHKPKKGVVLARVRNLRRDDRVTLLIDHWDEQWTRLSWVMVRGRAAADPDPPTDLMRALNRRYPQYAPDERHDALIRIRPSEIIWWAWT